MAARAPVQRPILKTSRDSRCARRGGLEPPTSGSKAPRSTIELPPIVVAQTGLEPASSAYETDVLPIALPRSVDGGSAVLRSITLAGTTPPAGCIDASCLNATDGSDGGRYHPARQIFRSQPPSAWDDYRSSVENRRDYCRHERRREISNPQPSD